MTSKYSIGAAVLRIICTTVICCVPFGCASIAGSGESAVIPAENTPETPPAASPRVVGLSEPPGPVAGNDFEATGGIGAVSRMPPEPSVAIPEAKVESTAASDIVTVGGLIGPPNHAPIENQISLGFVPDVLPVPQIAQDVPSGTIIAEVVAPGSGDPDIGDRSEVEFLIHRVGVDEPAMWLASYRMPLPEPPARITSGRISIRPLPDRDDAGSRDDASPPSVGDTVGRAPEQDASLEPELIVQDPAATGSEAFLVPDDRIIESIEPAEQTSPAKDDVFRSAIRLSRTGVTVPVLLDGYGWIYLPEETVTGYNFVERETTDTGMLFHFRVDEPGNYELAFQQQDSSSGTFARAYVDILGADASPSADENVHDGPDVVPGVPELVAHARTLFGEERYAESLSAYRGVLDLEDELEGYAANFPRAGLLAEAGSAAYRARDFGAAARYLLDAVASGAEPRYELFRDAIDSVEETGDGDLLKTYLAAIIEDEVPETREDYLRLARLFDHETEPLAVIDLLEATLGRFASTYRDDVVIFRLAAAYEVESEARNERLAYRLYRRIIDDYPMSALYDDAEARLSYIERHYLNIR